MFYRNCIIPNAEENGHYPKVEVMQDDYGEHNGDTKEIRMSDANLIISAPKMRDAINDVIEVLSSGGSPNTTWILERLRDAVIEIK